MLKHEWRVDKERFQRRFWMQKWKENCQVGDKNQDGKNRIGKIWHEKKEGRKEGQGMKPRRRSYGKTEISREALLSGDLLKV